MSIPGSIVDSFTIFVIFSIQDQLSIINTLVVRWSITGSLAYLQSSLIIRCHIHMYKDFTTRNPSLDQSNICFLVADNHNRGHPKNTRTYCTHRHKCYFDIYFLDNRNSIYTFSYTHMESYFSCLLCKAKVFDLLNG